MIAQVGIVGYRSWIGQALADRIQAETKHTILLIDKRDAIAQDTSHLKCLFIIPGKLEQTDLEKRQEMGLVERIGESVWACQRLVLLGSQSAAKHLADRVDPDVVYPTYGMHKWAVETAFYRGTNRRRLEGKQLYMHSIVVRPGAIFGPGQDVNAPMLIPQLAREGSDVELLTPDKPTKFVSIHHLTRFLVGLIDKDPGHGPCSDIPGQFEATPQAIKDLWETFAKIGR